MEIDVIVKGVVFIHIEQSGDNTKVSCVSLRCVCCVACACAGLRVLRVGYLPLSGCSSTEINLSPSTSFDSKCPLILTSSKYDEERREKGGGCVVVALSLVVVLILLFI